MLADTKAALSGGAILAVVSMTMGCPPSSSAQQQSQPSVDPAFAPYANTEDSARLPDGRTIHMVCMGQGSPVVILTAGSGDWGNAWYKVQPKVAEKTRVCAWDRPGVGMSSPTSPPPAVDKRTTDLQTALKIDGIKGPYVLVGHSLGGYESLLLKDREPKNVVGMVLVDPSYPGQVEAMERTTPATYAFAIAHPPSFVPYMLKCAADFRAGIVWHGKPDPNRCMTPPRPAAFPPELKAALNKAQIETGPENYANVFQIQATYQDWDFRRQDSTLVIKQGRNYGNMPLIILTAGLDDPLPPDAPAEAVAELSNQRHSEWVRAHDDLAKLSTRGANRIVPDSYHYIHQMKPQTVIDAINEVVDQTRADKR